MRRVLYSLLAVAVLTAAGLDLYFVTRPDARAQATEAALTSVQQCSAESPTAPREAPPAPAGLKLVVTGPASEAALAVVSDGTGRAHRYLEELLCGDVVDAKFYLADAANLLPETIATNLYGSWTARTTRTTAAVITTHPGWARASPLVQQQLVAQSYVGLWQEAFGCGRNTPGAPAWLTQGGALYFTMDIFVRDGLLPAGPARTQRQAQAKQVAANIALERFDSPAAEVTQDAIALGTVAFEQLVSPLGPSSYRRFCAEVRKAGDWQVAFTSVFGQSPDAFYKNFAALRRSW
jgi:hypothetical protein